MSRSVYVSGLKDMNTATKVAEELWKYHNRKYHFPGKSLYEKSEPRGHIVRVLELASGPVIEIPLFSNEPRRHGYDTVDGVVKVLRRMDPTLNHIAETINIKQEGL